MTLKLTPAHALKGGCLVRHQGRLWLKAERPAKDYVNHYLVATEPSPDLALHYIDPETQLLPVADVGRPAGLTPRSEGAAPQFGDLMESEAGRFIKVLDIKKDGQRHLAYVDIQSGLVRPRQERGVTAVYALWSLEI